VGIPKWSRVVNLGITDVLESPDASIFLLGFGPLFGAKNKEFYFPQIGIIKTNSADNIGNYCNYNSIIDADTLIITVNSHAFTSDSAGIAAPSHPVISNISLTEVDGCVYVFGSVEENTRENTLLVYPNPNDGKFQLQTKDVLYHASISITDMLGRCIYNKTLPEFNQNQVDISNQPDGLYYITITTKQSQYRTKLMVIK
jgi:hypothetical protein